MLSFRPLDRRSAARLKEVIDAAIYPRVGQAPAYAEFALERSEDRSDLGQLHVAHPQHTGMSCGKVKAEQVMSVAPFRLLEFFLIHTKLKSLPRALLAFPGYLHLHELKCAARCCFRGAQAHQ